MKHTLPAAFRPYASLPIWTAWKYVKPKKPGGSWRKVPLIPTGVDCPGEWASSDDPRTWGTYEQAASIGSAQGVVVVMGPLADKIVQAAGLPTLIELDLDDCRGFGIELAEWAREEIERCASYAELSSNDGVHIFGLMPAELKPDKKFKVERPALVEGESPGALEVLGGSNHPAVVTGDGNPDAPFTDLTARVKELYAEHHSAQAGSHTTRVKWNGKRNAGGPPYTEERGREMVPGDGRKHEIAELPDEIKDLLRKSHERGGRGPKAASVILSMYWHYFSFHDMIQVFLDYPHGVAGWAEGNTKEMYRQIINVVGKFAEPIIFWSRSANNHDVAITKVEQALIEADAKIYFYAGRLVHPKVREEKREDGSTFKTLGFEAITTVWMRELINAHVALRGWTKESEPRPLTVDECEKIAKDILERANYGPFPAVRGVLGCQSMRPDGSIVYKEDYDEATGYYFMNLPPMDSVPDKPTKRHLARARYILERLISETRFADGDKRGPNRAGAIAGLLSGPLRPMFQLAPGILIRAPEAGSGKGHLRDTISHTCTGMACPAKGYTRDDKEMDNRLYGVIRSGAVIFAIDNVNYELISGSSICRYITEEIYNARTFHKQDSVDCRERPLMIITGNQVAPSDDMIRRLLIVDLDAKVGNPGWSVQYKGNPIDDIKRDRGRVIWAVLTIARAFLSAQVSVVTPVLNGFVAWSNTVRSMTVAIGYKDPIEKMMEAKANDPRYEQLVREHETWALVIGIDIEVTTLDLLVLVRVNHALKEVFYAKCLDKHGRPSEKTLGASYLRSIRNKPTEGFRLEKTDRKRRTAGVEAKAAWVLRSLAEPGSEMAAEHAKLRPDVKAFEKLLAEARITQDEIEAAMGDVEDGRSRIARGQTALSFVKQTRH